MGQVVDDIDGPVGGDVEDDVGDDIGDGLTGDVADNISCAVAIPDGLIGDCVADMCTYWWLKMINVDLMYV